MFHNNDRRQRDFEKKTSVSLINPVKYEIGCISKVILDKINLSIKSQLNLSHWKNTKDVIDWFVNIVEKLLYKCVQFKILRILFFNQKASVGKSFEICRKVHRHTNRRQGYYQTRSKSLLFKKRETWMKNDSELFNVAMGVFDRAELCKLVTNFMLYKLPEKYERKNLALHRDDGLAIFKNVSRPA